MSEQERIVGSGGFAGEEWNRERVPLARFCREPADGKARSFGLLTQYSSGMSFLSPLSYTREYRGEKRFDPEKTTMFRTAQTTFRPRTWFQTGEKVYLVRYAAGGTILNRKTGKEQPTIDYTEPVEVLHTFDKQETVFLSVEGEELEVWSKRAAREGGAEPSGREEAPAGKGYYERLIPYSELAGDGAAPGNAYGIINYCKGGKGFINPSHVDRKAHPAFRLNYAGTVPFEAPRADIQPKGFRFDTWNTVYLVRFGTDGTCADPQTGGEHPAIDYSVPITVLRSFSKEQCSLLSVEESGVRYCGEESGAEGLRCGFDACLGRMLARMKEEIAGAGYLRADDFADIAREAGIPNFRLYTPSVEEFVNRYFPTLELRRANYPGGARHTGILIRRGSWEDVRERWEADAARETADRAAEYAELVALFQRRDYLGFLRSERFRQARFFELPESVQEMALTCAARVMYPGEEWKAELGLLERELLRAATGKEFEQRWKEKSGFSSEIMEACARSSLIGHHLPEDGKKVFAKLVSISTMRSYNDNYRGLTERFAACEDVLAMELYLLRLVTEQSARAVEKCVGEVCAMVKSLAERTDPSWAEAHQRLFGLPELLGGYLAVVPGAELGGNALTNVASVYFDSGCLSELPRLLDRLDPRREAREWKLLRLFAEPERWTEAQARELLESDGNVQLVQKTVAFLWERYLDEQELPEHFLRILAWVCVYDRHNSMDEILRYHLRPDAGKKEKQRQLLGSARTVCQMAEGEPALYALFTYLGSIAGDDAGEAWCPDGGDPGRSAALGERVYRRVRAELGPLSRENHAEFGRLFSLFRFDYPRLMEAQREYADWYGQQEASGACSAEKLSARLDELFRMGAYEAYTALFPRYAERRGQEGPEREALGRYVDSLIQLRRFAEAIGYLRVAQGLDGQAREALTIHVLAENFRLYALTPQAFQVFTPAFSRQEAETLLLDRVCSAPPSPEAANALMALCCQRGEHCRVLYLYWLYQKKAENGFTRLYTAIRGQAPQLYTMTSIKNRYGVIQWAFSALCPEDLVSFLGWAQRVRVPGWFKGTAEMHIFAPYFSSLLARPLDGELWEEFLAHLTNRMEQNLWMIVVCEAVLERFFSGSRQKNSGYAIRSLLENREKQKLPCNFLPYTLAYLIRRQRAELCERLIPVLAEPEVRERLVERNPWSGTYAGAMEEFRTFAAEQFARSGERRYAALAAALPMELGAGELAAAAQAGVDAPAVIRQLCRNYLQGKDLAESRALLARDDWQDLSRQDREALAFLRTLFAGDEELLARYPELFREEGEVRRLKADCAAILRAYPGKEGLQAFERDSVDPVYRMTVYAFVFQALYDESIYDRPDYSLRAVDLTDERARRAYLLFLRGAYLAQLEWNVTYGYLYQKWRYLKLLLDTVLLSPAGECDDGFILSAMERCGQYDEMFAEDYAPFRSDVAAFLAQAQLREETKRDFLLALMAGEIGWFLPEHISELSALSPEGKALTRRIIRRLDYREVSQSFFVLYQEDLRQGRLEQAAPAAEVLSVFLVDVVEALSGDPDESRAARILRSARAQHPVDCVRGLLGLEPRQFDDWAEIVVPVLYARQFPFQLAHYARRLLLKNGGNALYAESLLAKLRRCGEYAARRGLEGAEQTVTYLSAFCCCLRNDREGARRLLSGGTIRSGIPAAWLSESERMTEYVQGRQERFLADQDITDSSQAAGGQEVRKALLPLLRSRAGTRKSGLTPEEGRTLYGKYQDAAAPLPERFRAGAELLVNYPERETEEWGRLDLPKRGELLFALGLTALRPETGLPADTQLAVAAELLQQGIRGGKAAAERLEQLLEEFRKVLGREVSLQGWVDYAGSIKTYLGAVRGMEDFPRLIDAVLKPCREWLAPDCDNETRYAGYTELLKSIKGFTTEYAARVAEAIRRECRYIEDGPRLSLRILNRDGAVTDGCVYYQLQNIGGKTISADRFTIFLRQDDRLKQELRLPGIRELQSGLVTGGREKLIWESGAESAAVTLWVELSESGTIAAKTSGTLRREPAREEFAVTEEHRYETRFAVSEETLLFGRDDLKSKLCRSLDRGLTVLYGPSRIGKTSLLNWVRRDLAREWAAREPGKNRGEVVTILFGGEGGRGKESDYGRSFVPERYPDIPYGDSRGMSEYLLAHTIAEGLTRMADRSEGPGRKRLTRERAEEIAAVLRDEGRNIALRYREVEELLAEAGVELWLLLDEFQQVVERWKSIEVSCEFAQLCQRMAYPSGEERRIKLVLCGSDDLLCHMVLEDASVWRTVFHGCGIPVEPLEREPFFQMMTTDPGIAGANLDFSQEAKEALFQYTGGVALYGKEIGNVLLGRIRREPESCRGRNTIYVSDIVEATQTLLNQQAEELKRDAKEGIREIYDAVTKNLDHPDAAGKQYLYYIAWYLHQHPEENGFPESAFTQRRLLHGEQSLRDALKIAEERNILRSRETELGRGKVYTFRTVFYYNAFLSLSLGLGPSQDRLMEDEIFAPEEAEEPAAPVEEIKRAFHSLSDRERMDAMAQLYHGEDFERNRESFRKDIGNVTYSTNIHTGDNVEGGKVAGNLYHINVQVQNITNALNSIQAAGSEAAILQGLQQLPRLSAYFEQGELPLLEEKLTSEDPEIAAEAEARLEETSGRMAADYRTALAAREEREPFQVWSELGILRESYENLTRAMEPDFVVDLYFAAKLDAIFGKVGSGEDEAETAKDFSPVSIMYCKLLEKMLKFYHLAIYRERADYVRVKDGGGEWRRMSELSEEECRGELLDRLTIGTFLTPFSKDPELVRRNCERLAGEDGNPGKWMKHGEMLGEVLKIRNLSAHGTMNTRLDERQLKRLKAMLFPQKGLSRVISLSREDAE